MAWEFHQRDWVAVSLFWAAEQQRDPLSLHSRSDPPAENAQFLAFWAKTTSIFQRIIVSFACLSLNRNDIDVEIVTGILAGPLSSSSFSLTLVSFSRLEANCLGS